jgi:hypothetical protein
MPPYRAAGAVCQSGLGSIAPPRLQQSWSGKAAVKKPSRAGRKPAKARPRKALKPKGRSAQPCPVAVQHPLVKKQSPALDVLKKNDAREGVNVSPFRPLAGNTRYRTFPGMGDTGHRTRQLVLHVLLWSENRS